MGDFKGIMSSVPGRLVKGGARLGRAAAGGPR